MSKSLYYFAYGSNMSIARLKARVPSAKRVAICHITGHSLRFDKVGSDGSGKCHAYQTNDSSNQLYGVLFSINASEKAQLDIIEGVGQGYEIKAVQVSNQQGEQIDAFTYSATQTNTKLLPYSWYLNHVIIGAKEAQLPAHYLAHIATIATIEDHDQQRDRLERAIYDPN